MLLNYLKLAIRLLIRNPLFTFINVLSLSVGFAVFFILWQHTKHELTSDQYHRDYKRIYRLCYLWAYTDSDGNPDKAHISRCNPEIARLTAEDLGEVEEFTRVLIHWNFRKSDLGDHDSNVFFTYLDDKGNKTSLREWNVAYADTNLFTFFTIPLLKGNPHKVLQQTNAVALSENAAKRYFGDTDAIGKILLLNGKIPLQVSGVFQDLPTNGHLDFDIVISSRRIDGALFATSASNFFSYYKVRSDISLGVFQKKVNEVAMKYTRVYLDRIGNKVLPQIQFYLQPLKDIVFPTQAVWGDKSSKSKQLLFVFQIVAIIILGMAWINYINLSISSNYRRIKELAARKAIGARPSDFVSQFIIEAMIINILSILIAITFVQLLKEPVRLLFNFYVPEWHMISGSAFIILAFAIIVGITLTGCYPAIVALRHTPKTLFGLSTSKNQDFSVSKVLTTLQLICAVVLIIWIFSVAVQINYILNKDLGFTKKNIIVAVMPTIPPENPAFASETFKNRMLANPKVIDVTFSSSLPGDNTYVLKMRHKDKIVYAEANGGVDERFIDFYDIRMIAGRNFVDHAKDSSSIIISRKIMEQLGYDTPAEAIAQKIFLALSSSSQAELEIIGVFEDYASNPFFSLYKARGNVLTFKHFNIPDFKSYNNISILLKQGDLSKAISQIQKHYDDVFPGNVFTWQTLDDRIGKEYNREKIERNQIILFTCIAIGIACLGLLGIFSIKAEQKTKEIGIRKVLGAQLYDISQILINTTIRQAIVAVVIGIPVSYYMIQKYLEKFSERISFSWWYYAIPIAILLLILLATIASTLIKAVRTNPVESLRYE